LASSQKRANKALEEDQIGQIPEKQRRESSGRVEGALVYLTRTFLVTALGNVL